MKRSILFISIILLSKILQGQQIEISIAPTINSIYHSPAIVGLPDYDAKLGFNAGLHLSSSTEKRLNIKYGINYQHAEIQIDPFIDPQYNPPPYEVAVNLFSLEVTANLNLRHMFYISLGPTLDLSSYNNLEISLDDQTGVGLSFGIGKRLRLKDNLSININPNLWIHNVIPIKEKDSPLKLVVAGLSAGIIFTKNPK